MMKMGGMRDMMCGSGARGGPPQEMSGPPAEQLWAIVLAGGEGVRLRPLARRVCGDDRPKQYVPLLGARTLLGQTLDRVALGIPPARTVVSPVQAHARYIAAERSASQARVLVQPAEHGTGPGILFPAHWISWRAPDATLIRPKSRLSAIMAPSTYSAMRGMATLNEVLRHSDYLAITLPLAPSTRRRPFDTC
jgi:hypothetical protein